MPEGPQIARLPAFDWFRRGFVAGVRCQIVCERPTADAGTIGFEIESAMQFAGAGTVGGGWFGGEQLFEQVLGGDRPDGLMIATGDARRPGLGLTAGTSPEVLAVELIEAGMAQAKFLSGGLRHQPPLPMVIENVPDERGRESFDQLPFFMAGRMSEADGFCA